MNYVYIFLILLIFIFLICTLVLNMKFSPIKVKLAVCINIAGLMLKYITEMAFLFRDNLKYLYMIKTLYNLDLCFLPITAIIAGYIFLRNSKIKFSKVILVQLAFLILYGVLAVFNETIIRIDNDYNYFVIFSKQQPVDIGYIILNIVLLVLCIKHYSKKSVDKKGFFIESLGLFTITCGVFYNQVRLLGSCILIYALLYGVKKFSRSYLDDNK